MSLSDYIKKELARSAEQMTLKEWFEIVSRSTPVETDVSAAEIIREMRDSR